MLLLETFIGSTRLQKYVRRLRSKMPLSDTDLKHVNLSDFGFITAWSVKIYHCVVAETAIATQILLKTVLFCIWL